jgi:hypothetical protein
MTTETAQDARPIEDTDDAITAPVAITPLEARIKARRKEIIASLVELKAQTGSEVAQTRGKLKAKLSELGHILAEGVVDGWASIGDVAKHKLDHWLTN